MVKDGRQHIQSLCDGRAICIDGKVVANHTEHPAFRRSIQSAARLYDYQAQPENLDAMTFVSPRTGRPVNRMWQLPSCYEELVVRRKALEAWAELSCGFLGRSPDHVASALSGMYMGLERFRSYDPNRAAALSDYYEYARDNDLYLTYAIVNPQVDRSKSAGEQGNPLVAASVVDEDSAGITVVGAKMLATGCPMANEVLVGAIQPLKPGEERYSFTAAVPLNSSGLKVLSRKSYEADAKSRFDNPLSSRFDENDSVLYFENVKIPWSRVFVHDNVEMASAQWHSMPTHCYQNYQCQIRFVVKMRFLLGLAHKIAEVNGIVALPPVREMLGQLAAEVSMVEGMVESMEVSGSMFGQYFVPNPRRLYAASVLTQQLYPKFTQSVRELAGGGMIMVPSSVEDYANGEIAPYIEKTQHSAATDPVERVKLFKLAWDAIGSEFGSRHLQYEMFYSGAAMVTRGHAFRCCDWNGAVGLVDGFMATYETPTAAAKPAQETSVI